MIDHAAAFELFHEKNPGIMTSLIDLARMAKNAGHEHYGIGALFEVLRWNRTVQVRGKDDFKLNNNHRAYYARHIMGTCPDLVGFFEIRDPAFPRGRP